MATRDVVEVAVGSGWVTEHTTLLPGHPGSVCPIERTIEERASGQGWWKGLLDRGLQVLLPAYHS